MAKAKKKTATKTAKKQSQGRPACKKAATKTCRVNKQEKLHVYVITAMGLIAGILLCANAAMMMV